MTSQQVLENDVKMICNSREVDRTFKANVKVSFYNSIILQIFIRRLVKKSKLAKEKVTLELLVRVKRAGQRQEGSGQQRITELVVYVNFYSISSISYLGLNNTMHSITKDSFETNAPMIRKDQAHQGHVVYFPFFLCSSDLVPTMYQLFKITLSSNQTFSHNVHKEFEALTVLKTKAETTLQETLVFFGEDKSMPNEQFFGVVTSFLRQFEVNVLQLLQANCCLQTESY